jgi:hypothetical protein
LVQPEDDLPHSLPMIPHSNFVLHIDHPTDHFLDIRIGHDLVELRMTEVFQEADLKSFGSSTFLLISGEGPCSKFQPAYLIDFLTSKHMNAYFCLGRLHGWLHWRVVYVDLSHIIDHLAAWLHWSFEYVD